MNESLLPESTAVESRLWMLYVAKVYGICVSVTPFMSLFMHISPIVSDHSLHRWRPSSLTCNSPSTHLLEIPHPLTARHNGNIENQISHLPPVALYVTSY